MYRGVCPEPIRSSQPWATTTGQAAWLLALFGASIGLPFFALSPSAPLLQAWFARSGHPASADPYFLYGASNLGSVAALLGYPLLVEPVLTLGEHGRIILAAS